MGPRSFDRGNAARQCRGRIAKALLQWGRGHSTAEIARSARGSSTTASEAASMGPRSFDRGNIGCRNQSLPSPLAASMGPRSFDRGNRHALSADQRAVSSFNGAAVIRPRKSPYATSAADALVRFNGAAVIRPRKCMVSMPAACTILRLQWGRGHSTAEMRLCIRRVLPRARSLQWGRGHSTAEMTDSPVPLTLALMHASMGPRSFDRGNRHRTMRHYHEARLLQWGRGHSTAEMMRSL